MPPTPSFLEAMKQAFSSVKKPKLDEGAPPQLPFMPPQMLLHMFQQQQQLPPPPHINGSSANLNCQNGPIL